MKLKRMLAILSAVCLLCALCACRDMKKEEINTNQSTAATQNTTQNTNGSGKNDPELPDLENEGKTEIDSISGKEDAFAEDGMELPDDPLNGTIPDPEPVPPTVVVESTRPSEENSQSTGESRGQSADGDLELPPDDFEQP